MAFGYCSGSVRIGFEISSMAFDEILFEKSYREMGDFNMQMLNAALNCK